jgi:hypothetical protein
VNLYAWKQKPKRKPLNPKRLKGKIQWKRLILKEGSKTAADII